MEAKSGQPQGVLKSIAPQSLELSVNDFPSMKTCRRHWSSEGHFGNFYFMKYDSESETE